MLWDKKQQEVTKALSVALAPFLRTRLKGVKPNEAAAAVAEDLGKTAIRLDMSRSATRLRRRLYAQWGKWDMAEGELVRLGANGLEQRPNVPDPDEVGDLHLDLFRVVGVVKMMGLGATRLSNADRVKGVTLILKTIHGKTRATAPALSENAVAVYMCFYAVEANREVVKSAVRATVKRFLVQWEVPAIPEEEIDAHVETLAELGAIKDAEDPTKWRMADRVSYPW